MIKPLIFVLSAGFAGIAASADMNMAHAHMGHVTSGWKDTPANAGLLPTAMDEAKIAIQHADLAAQKTDDLSWMKTHTVHIIHAIDPSQAEKGPGNGYGVLAAAQGVSKHIGLAAASEGASEAIKLHAEHVSTAAANTADRAEKILTLAKQVLDADSASEASAKVEEIQALSHQLVEGADADGDGKITWQAGEGGLAESAKHMGFMAKAEGM
ncbi:hypothetical protein [Motiliproteus sp. SC1-56]|uniref:hypothetical protein n=1 Tax=Motiliproteus sp. SC1-56 TaxID=2799565 RepID=UPI001A8E0A55|nr:hypothetical protein [Motiliproteus sp. SC1-56]